MSTKANELRKINKSIEKAQVAASHAAHTQDGVKFVEAHQHLVELFTQYSELVTDGIRKKSALYLRDKSARMVEKHSK